ncbi:hypothetical protein LCGC14_0232430 [marine sediment metagenome]|uniref:Uncharacterized protein n=1 Tax=marine sediment metagenome TaxID=412755 RepID=A0A0F9URI3_9ZZZZ
MPSNNNDSWVVMLPRPGVVWGDSIHFSLFPPSSSEIRQAAICRYGGILPLVNIEVGLVSFIGVFNTSAEAVIFRNLYNAF